VIDEPIVGRRYRVTFGRLQGREIVGTLHADFADEDGRWLRFIDCEIVNALPVADYTVPFASIAELRTEA
jgi:hypothetical protein